MPQLYCGLMELRKLGGTGNWPLQPAGTAELNMRLGSKGSIVRHVPAGYRSVRVGAVRDLDSCRAELNRVMQAVAVVGSIVNALEKRSVVAVDLDGLIRFLPTRRRNAVEMARTLVAGGIEQQTCTDVLSIYNQLYLCAELTKNYATGAFGDELGLAPAAHAWRQLAEACLTVDCMFAGALVAKGPAAPESARVPHSQLLAAVSAGLSPCVDERGAIVAPGWAEPRIHQRIADVEIPVEICAGGEWRPATISDFSAQGFGLLGSAEVRVGDVISIEFEAGMAVLCTVRWSANGRFGVSINGSLQSALIEVLKTRATAASGA
jgi:hypothetical protein